MGMDKVGEIAIELEKQALGDAWFSSRNIYPNIDFWTAIILHTMGFPSDMFPVWMLLPRVAGLISHWQESLDDPEYKIYRPRQIYTGITLRKYSETLLGSSDTIDMVKLNSDYVKSDPVAALRRKTGDPRSLADLVMMISNTEREIERVNFEIGKQNGEDASEAKSPSLLEGIVGLARQFSQRKSLTDLNMVLF